MVEIWVEVWRYNSMDSYKVANICENSVFLQESLRKYQIKKGHRFIRVKGQSISFDSIYKVKKQQTGGVGRQFW